MTSIDSVNQELDNVLSFCHLSHRTDADIQTLKEKLNPFNIESTTAALRKLIDSDDNRLTYDEIDDLKKEKQNALDIIILCFELLLAFVIVSIPKYGEHISIFFLAGLFVVIGNGLYTYFNTSTILERDSWK